MKYSALLLFTFLAYSCQTTNISDIAVEGELMQWHKVTLLIQGPETSEYADENPFLDYKLDVSFTNGTNSYTVPGYYAADGQAGESSSREGAIWKVHFRPDEPGDWTYSVSFLKGKNIAILDGDIAGEPVGSHGMGGTLEIGVSDKAGPDFRAHGRIINGGKGYFKFQGTGQLWIKNGADSPENFLAFKDFDQTQRFSLKNEVREGEADPKEGLHAYEAHISDWKEGDPTWQNGLGKGIIGAVNYLQSQGVNSIYMLTMNILGDGKDVWPYSDYNERYRFDCSKLDQWEVVFDHMESLGMMAHFVLQETENEVLLDNGYTDVQRRIYLCELAARYGHHLGITWNLGEENGPHHWTPIGQTDQQKKDMANYLRTLIPWRSNIVLHTHSDDEYQDEYLEPMLGTGTIDGPSMQIANPLRVHERMKHWVEASEVNGERWVVCLDEIGPASKGVMPDADDVKHDTVRNHCLWGSLMAGGSGVEWYFGYRFAHNDLNLEDFRSREIWWKQSTLATQFMNQYPLEELSCQDELVDVPGAYCLTREGELYLVYLPAGSPPAKLKLKQASALKVFWFNPRTGGELQQGSVTSIQGQGNLFLGMPPSDTDLDWVVVVQS
ncbi:MAG: DUF5060 domain-containing protein [Bacteroidota bacterium]|nr:DUF5060 domain-containing protein [Bacteroidota bacterium]